MIKLIRRRLNMDDFVRHFRTERQVLANLNHASIPVLIDAGQLGDGRPYLVCEFVDGVPIDRFCDDNELREDARLRLVEKIAGAVQHAHNNLVLHLDIKPDNILVEQDGTPRLLDFGVARLINDSEVGHEAFTPEYASPEQLQGKTLSVNSDIYSLGVLLYRILTGRTPFDAPRFAASENKIADRQSFAETIRKPLASAELNPDLHAIVAKATARDRSERYASIDAFSRDLRDYRQKRPVSARGGGFLYRAGKFSRRHAVAIAAVIGIFAVLATFAIRENSLHQQMQAAYLVAEREAETSSRVSAFMTELFRLSDPGEARSNEVTARELLDNGAQRIDEELRNRPLVQSQLMRVMGDVYLNLGLNDEALPLLQKSVRIRETALDAEDAELGTVLTQLGLAYLKEGRFDDAATNLLRGLDIRKSVLGPEDEAVAHTLTYVGVLRTFQNDYADAENSLLQAVSIYEKNFGPEYSGLAETYSNLAGVYFRVGRLADAEEFFLRSIAIEEKEHGPDHPWVATRLDNLGNVYNTAGRNDEAIAVQRRSLAIREKTLPPKHPEIAQNLDNLANAYAAIGQVDESETLRLRALAIREEIFGPQHPHIATSLGNLGSLYLKRGQLDKAEDYLLRSMAIKERIYNPDSPRLATGLLNLGNIYLQRNKLATAEDVTLRAIAILKRKLPDNHLYRMYSDWQLANIYRDSDRLGEAEALYERVEPLWRSRPAGDVDRDTMLADYALFLEKAGRGESG